MRGQRGWLTGGIPLLWAATHGAFAQETVPVLDPIMITSTRIEATDLEAPASVTALSGESMRNARMRVNLSEGMGGVPGLQIQNRENLAQDLQVSVRGFGARSTFGVRGVRLYVDGIPGTMPDGQGQTSNIDIASIERIEVLRGPFSALYGNSSGGVIQVFTEDGKHPPELSGSMAAGSHGSWRYGAKARGLTDIGDAELDYVVSLNRYSTQGYRDHSGARKNLGNAKLGIQLDEQTRLTLIANSVNIQADDLLGLSLEDFQERPSSAVANASLYNTRKSVTQTQGGLVFKKRVDDQHELRAMLYYGERNTVQYLAIPQVAQRNPQHSGGVIDLERRYAGADLRWTSLHDVWGRPLTLVVGLAYDELRETRRGYENFSGGTLGVKGALRRNERNKVWNLDPYVQASWQLTPEWAVDAGLRHSTIHFSSRDHYLTPGNGDDSGKARYQEWLPVGALRYSPTPDLSFYVSAGRGFETPTFNEISYRNDGLPGLNFDLMPAVNTNIELGAKARVAGGTLTAAVYQSRTEDEIVAADARFGRTTYQNAGRTRRTGLELAWSGTMLEHLQTQLAYGWINAKYRDDCMTISCTQASRPDEQLQAGHRIPGIAKQAFYISVDWLPEEGFRAGIDGRYLSRIPVNDGNTGYAPSYFVAGAHAGYVWRNGPLRVGGYARVDNLFDRQYAGSVIVNEGNQRYYEPAPGRNWTVGVDVAFTF